MKADPACNSIVAALEDDPFYRSISEAFAGDVAERRTVLARYFAYSIEEGRTLGRTIHLADPSQGVAVWLLPRSDEIQTSAAERKRLFLTNTLGALRFRTVARFEEPTTAAEYAIMVRNPRTPHA